MRLLAGVVEALLVYAFIAVAHGNFVTSLHSNYVVNLDFEGDTRRAALDASAGEAQPEEVENEGDVKVMAFAGGQRKFKCRLPSRNATVSTNSRSDDVAKSKAHFINAKLVNLRHTCWKMKKDFWTYDVCFGRKITQYRPDGDSRFSLGEYRAGSDELLPNGGVTQLYVGGTDNRTSEIRYVCGTSESTTRTFIVEEPQALYYVWTISGPQFCAWREKDGGQARDKDGNILKASAMLEEMRGNCVNVTQGWWTYEYCYPHTLSQYHLGSNGKTRDPEYILGIVDSNADVRANLVEMTMVRLKPSISPRERRAPPSNHRTLRQRLGGGTVCDETSRPRTASMHFQCPTNWQTRPPTGIISINEGSLCDYKIIVHTTLVCGHEKFLPTLPRGKETIQCAIEPTT